MCIAASVAQRLDLSVPRGFYRRSRAHPARRMRRMNKLVVLLAVISACKSSEASPQAVACETGVPELVKQLEAAQGFGQNLADPQVKQALEPKKAALLGKRYTFSNCAFKSQGNDEVAFAVTRDSTEDLDCVVAGGKDGHRAFRHAAMQFDMAKLELDVTGVIAEVGDPPFNRLKLAECEITPHE
jgi:hypothetical protein